MAAANGRVIIAACQYYQTFYRNHDAALARFVSVDPMAETVESMSTYQYAGNNPVMNNDPMGDIFYQFAKPIIVCNFQDAPGLHWSEGGGGDGSSGGGGGGGANIYDPLAPLAQE